MWPYQRLVLCTWHVLWNHQTRHSKNVQFREISGLDSLYMYSKYCEQDLKAHMVQCRFQSSKVSKWRISVVYTPECTVLYHTIVQ